jgi:hypothetical protein
MDGSIVVARTFQHFLRFLHFVHYHASPHVETSSIPLASIVHIKSEWLCSLFCRMYRFRPLDLVVPIGVGVVSGYVIWNPVVQRVRQRQLDEAEALKQAQEQQAQQAQQTQQTEESNNAANPL